MAEGYTPEEDYTQDGYERNEDENIEMKDRDSSEQTQDGFVEPPEEETSFADLPDAFGTIESPALTLNCIRGGGSMVPNIWFFGSRILTPQYFGLIIFVIA